MVALRPIVEPAARPDLERVLALKILPTTAVAEQMATYAIRILLDAVPGADFGEISRALN